MSFLPGVLMQCRTFMSREVLRYDPGTKTWVRDHVASEPPVYEAVNEFIAKEKATKPQLSGPHIQMYRDGENTQVVFTSVGLLYVPATLGETDVRCESKSKPESKPKSETKKPAADSGTSAGKSQSGSKDQADIYVPPAD